jgi:hypothetical protein
VSARGAASSVSQSSVAAQAQQEHQEQARTASTEQAAEAAARYPSSNHSHNHRFSRIRNITRASSRRSQHQHQHRTRTRTRTSQQHGNHHGGESSNNNNPTRQNDNRNNQETSSTNNIPLSVSLGFSPLGVSAARRQTSETPRLIFRNPAHNHNNNNTNNTRSSPRSHPHQSRTTSTGTGTRTSWQANDPQGGHHYLFTYSASSSSSGGGERDRDSLRIHNARRRRAGHNTHNQGTTGNPGSQAGQGHPYQRRTTPPRTGTGVGVGVGSTTAEDSAPIDLQPDLDELHRELRVMEHLFSNLFPGAVGMFQQAAQDAASQASWDATTNNPNQSNTGPPPASSKAIRQLPTIRVADIDLLDESNRECCICFEPHNLGDKLTRLPCGHLFHGPCVQEWLHKHCTCPVCRYELETNDAQYEVGRLERMKHRKPRYHKYELERMSVRELRDLMSKCRIGLTKGMATEKSDLVDLLVNSGRITVISTASVPEIFATSTSQSYSSSAGDAQLVHYKLSVLRQMSIGGLKKLMSDHGVFYDPADVVEKEDMVQIFVNSGRLSLLPEDEANEVAGNGHNRGIASDASAIADAGAANMGEAVIEGNEYDDDTMVGASNGASASAAGADPVESSLESSMVELSRSDADISQASNTGTNREVRGSTEDWEMIDDGNDNDNENASPTNERGSSSASSSGLEESGDTIAHQEESVESTATTESDSTSPMAASTASNASPNQEANANSTTTTTTTRTGGPSTAAAAVRPHTTTTTAAGATATASSTHLTGLSISQLKQVAYELNVNIGDCLEKREMIERIADAAHARRSNSGTNAQ